MTEKLGNFKACIPPQEFVKLPAAYRGCSHVGSSEYGSTVTARL